MRPALRVAVRLRFAPGSEPRSGARVDREAGVARLPRELVECALAGRPREVLRSGATAEQDVVLDGSAVSDFGCSVAVCSRQLEVCIASVSVASPLR